MQISIDDKNEYSRLLSPVAPTIVRKPSGEAKMMSDSEKGVYRKICVLSSLIPILKSSSSALFF